MVSERIEPSGQSDESLDVGLSPSELKSWRNEIKTLRSAIVRPPVAYVNIAWEELGLAQGITAYDLDDVIKSVRASTYSKYLQDEATFQSAAMRKLSSTRSGPRRLLQNLIDQSLDAAGEDGSQVALTKAFETVSNEYAANTVPYAYFLALSTTQSRRTRAGREFELIIEKILESFQIEYQAQSSIGAKLFKDRGLGKAVDFVIPGADAYDKDRTKCSAITAKTTLRERWQQVAEELKRTGLPAIYLATLDTTISQPVAERLIEHNIRLVVFASEKVDKFAENTSVYSFDDLFRQELPQVISYWEMRRK